MANCIKCERVISARRVTKKRKGSKGGKITENIFCKTCFLELDGYFKKLGEDDGQDYSNWLHIPEVKTWINSHRTERRHNEAYEKNTVSLESPIPPQPLKAKKKISPRLVNQQIQWLWQDYDFGATIIQRIIFNDYHIDVSVSFIESLIREFKTAGFKQNQELVNLRREAQNLRRQIGTAKWNQLSVIEIAHKLMKRGISPTLLLPLFQSERDRYE